LKNLLWVSLRPLRIVLAHCAVKDFNRRARKGLAKCAKVELLAAFGVLALVTLPDCMAENKVPAEKIDHIFAGMNSTREPGAAVLVIRDGVTIFERGYGISDLRSLHKIDAQTDFRLASYTKQFTATAVMLLVHDSKLHYEDRLTDVFPDFPEYGKSITIF
jgi:CubicO group peptidase (beta-lactamase class C family)